MSNDAIISAHEIPVILFLLSIFFSFLIALLIQRTKKPQLEMQISKYSFHDQNRMKIAHIRVRNKPVKYLSRWMNRDFATNCRANVEVKDASNEQLIKNFHELKWALNPEPLKYDLQGNKIVVMIDPAIMMTAGIKNLGERWEDLDIALKRQGEEEFYMNTPQNYPLNVKHERNRIDARKCFIDIIVEYDNGKSNAKRFYLRNDSNGIVDFELSENPFS